MIASRKRHVLQRGPRARFATGLALAVLLACAPSMAWSAGLTVGREVQTHLGVVTQKLIATRRAGEIDAFAKVLDPGPLAQLVADLATAEAAAEASHAEAERAKALNSSGGAVSAKDMEAAVAQARSDALRVTALRRRLGLEWGPGIARMSKAQRAKLVNALSAGAAALVHVDTHNNDGQAGARVVKIDVGPDSVRGVVIGPARAAEPRLQSSGLIVEVMGRSAILLSVGLTQSAHIESASPQTGYILPRSALIRFRGSEWAYVRTGPTTFERRLVLNPTPQEAGYFVPGGFANGDEVVVQGAAALFAAEQTASAEGR